jgi:pilus assembly protein Flp/PilA
MNTFKNLIKDDSGATAIEYGLIAALVAVVIIGVLTTVGNNLNDTFVEVRRPPGRRPGDLTARSVSWIGTGGRGGRRCRARRLDACPADSGPWRQTRLPSVAQMLAHLRRNNEGGVAIEYGLIAALIVVAILGVLGDVSDALIGLPLGAIIDALSNAVS